MLRKPCILSLFHNLFNKFNKTCMSTHVRSSQLFILNPHIVYFYQFTLISVRKLYHRVGMTFLLFLQYQMRLVFTLNIKPLPTGIIKLTLCMLGKFASGIPCVDPESFFRRGPTFFCFVNEMI